MKVLVTGFDPFGGESVNPALQAVMGLPNKIDDLEIIKIEVPTVFNKSLNVIKNAIATYKPNFVLSIGQAGGRFDITVERVAINIDDARIADNDGNQPIDIPVVEGANTAHFSTLPVKAMVESCLNAGIPASLSNTAGTFVCNHVMYGVLDMCSKEFKGTKAGFIHVPYVPEQVIDKKNTPSMSKDYIIKGLTACIKAIVKDSSNLPKTYGEIC